jgi:phage gp36-like protein
MPYCNTNDLLKLVTEDVLIQLSDLENTGAIDADVIAEAIETSDAQIDGYIANKVADVPLIQVPALITKISAKMTLHELYSNRTMTFAPDNIASWYKECLRMLEAIRSGKLQIDFGTAQSGVSEYRINKDADSAIFPKDVLDKY